KARNALPPRSRGARSGARAARLNRLRCVRRSNVLRTHDAPMRRREEPSEEWSGSEDHFRFLVEHTSDLVSIVAPDGVIVYISPSSEHVLGRRPSRLVGAQAFDLVHPDDLDRVRAGFAE